MTAWMIISLLGLAVSLPMFNDDDLDAEDEVPETPDPVEGGEEITIGQLIDGTLGNDSLFANEGDTVVASDGDDTLAATMPDTSLSGGDGADDITLGAANGVLTGDDGADTLQIEGSLDPETPSTFQASGGEGDDTITASALGGIVNGDAGDDVINVEGRLDAVFGGAGDDQITADSAAFDSGSPINAGAGDDTITLTESRGVNTQTIASGEDGDDRLITQMIVGENGVDVFDIFTGGQGQDVFEMRFVPDTGPAGGGALGTILQIADFNAAEDQLVVDLSTFPVFAQQADAQNEVGVEVVERADGTGSDVNFTVANADATAPLTGTIALQGVSGLAQDAVSLVFSGVQGPT